MSVCLRNVRPSEVNVGECSLGQGTIRRVSWKQSHSCADETERYVDEQEKEQIASLTGHCVFWPMRSNDRGQSDIYIGLLIQLGDACRRRLCFTASKQGRGTNPEVHCHRPPTAKPPTRDAYERTGTLFFDGSLALPPSITRQIDSS
ncbi:unnamed protein product [Soboliphyme baturini]|uniref:Uncharacterized protein n=1 Tax=Soboliphyme baturini TaxID=241478 RepID=A0A183IEL4_9BILA|nr:unnamed protein product [Soboliphyme baturini]